jgi:TRAP-type C4-dicarboxylate transport system permease small subunit
VESNTKILNAVKYISAVILTLGIIMFSLGIIESEYKILTPIGMGTITGAGFIFIIGMFFVAAEEMIQKTNSRG